MTKKISVLVSCYNTASYLDKCLQSLRSQTLKAFEIIVVDDGSKDQPESVVKKFQEVIFIRHEKNRGQNAAKNTGLKKAKGEFVFFADSDDIYYPNCLEELAEALEKNPKASYSYCDFNFKRVDSNKVKLNQTGKFELDRLKRKSYFNGSSLFRRNELISPDEKIRRFTDWDLFLSLAEQNKFGVWVQKPLFESHFRRESISSGGDYDREFWRLKVQQKHNLAPKVAILTFTWNRLDYTKRTFGAMKKLGYPFDHFVWDNGSTDKTTSWLDQYEKLSAGNIKIFKSKKNIGIAAAKNQLLEKIGTKYDYLLKLDNDCEIVSDDILRELIILSRVFKDNVMLSPKVEGLNRPVPRYAFFKVGPHVLSPVPMVGGIFSFAPQKFYNSFSSNELFRHAYDDVEFAGHVWKQGGKIYYVDDLVVFHMETTSGQLLRYPKYFEQKSNEIQEERDEIKKTGTKVDFGIKNASYWWEVYRIDKSPKFMVTSILYRSGFIKPYNSAMTLLNSTIKLYRKITK